MLLFLLFCIIHAKKRLWICNEQCPAFATEDKCLEVNSNSCAKDFFLLHARKEAEIELNFYSKQEGYTFEIDSSIFGDSQVTLKTSSESKLVKILFKDASQSFFKAIDIKPDYQVILPFHTPFQTKRSSNSNILESPKFTPIPISISTNQMIITGTPYCQTLSNNCNLDDLNIELQYPCIRKCRAQPTNPSNFSYTFKGVKFAVYGTFDRFYGRFNIEVDNEFVVQINEIGDRHEYVRLFISDEMEYGEHTVKFVDIGEIFEIYKLEFWPSMRSIRYNSTSFTKVTGEWMKESDGVGGVREYVNNGGSATIDLKCSKFWLYGIQSPNLSSFDLKYDDVEDNINQFYDQIVKSTLLYESAPLSYETHSLTISSRGAFNLYAIYIEDPSIEIEQPQKSIPISVGLKQMTVTGSTTCANSHSLKETSILDLGCNYTDLSSPDAYQCGFRCWSDEATFSYTFIGVQFGIYGSKNSTLGFYSVQVDEEPAVILNQKSAESVMYELQYASDVLEYGSHTVTISPVNGTFELYKLVYYPYLNAKRVNSTFFKKSSNWITETDGIGGSLEYIDSSDTATATGAIKCNKFWVYGLKGSQCETATLSYNDIEININLYSKNREDNVLVYESEFLPLNAYELSFKTNGPFSLYCVYYVDSPQLPLELYNDNIKYSLKLNELIISGVGPMNDYSEDDQAPWLENSDLIKNVTINEGVTTIGSYSFYNCKNLESVTLPSSLEAIGSYGFYQCSQLKTILINGNVTTIGDYAFYWCNELSDISLPASVSSIGVYAFCYTRLKSFTFPEKVTIIEYAILEQSYYLHNVTILGNVTTIRTHAFFSCDNLPVINLPKSVSRIDQDAFSYCRAIKTFEFPEKITIINISVVRCCYSLLSVTFLGNVTTIRYGAFLECYSLQQIIIPETVTYIEDDAFNRCYSLASINIPKNVNKIGRCFYVNHDLIIVYYYGLQNPTYENSMFSATSVKFAYVLPEYKDDNFCGIPVLPFPGKNITYSIRTDELIIKGTGTMSDYAPNNFIIAPWYENRTIIKKITIEEGVTTIGSYSFYMFSNFESITIPHSINSIRPFAFSNCTKLKSFHIPETIYTIEAGVFVGCSNLTLIDIHENISQIEFKAFAKCVNLETILLPSNLTKLRLNSFYECYKLNSISIPAQITIIEPYSFYNCSMLSSVVFQGDITVIQDFAFHRCNQLKNISLPKSLSEIGNYAFGNCQNIRAISIPENVKDIGYYAFLECSNLKTVEFLGDIILSIESGCFYSCKNLISINIPNSTTKIGGDAFRYCKSLTHFEFPEKVTSISVEVLRFCDNLKSVVFHGNVTSIEDYAFESCYNLQEIKIPENVTFLGNSAFSGCRLTSIVIPKNVNNIGTECFYYCSSLRAVYFLGMSNPSYGSNVFTNTLVTCGYVLPEYQDSNFCGLPVGMFPTQIFSATQIFTFSSLFTFSEAFSSSFGFLPSHQFTQSLEFSSTSKFTETSLFSSSSKFTQSYTFTSSYNFTPSDNFKQSSIFTPSIGFTYSFYFTESRKFSTSSKFTQSSIFSPSIVFSNSFYFTESSKFSNSVQFSPSSKFTQSSIFSPSIGFTYSFYFTESRKFSTSSKFTQSSIFSPSIGFSNSFYFTESRKFSNSFQFSPSESFPYDLSGECGINMKFTLYSNELTIFGSGEMTNYSENSKAPWIGHADSIKVVKIEDGVNTIGTNAFDSCTFLEIVTIPQSVNNIYQYAFNNCTNLKSIELPEKITRIESNCFYGCSNLLTIVIHGQITDIGDQAFCGCTILENIEFTTHLIRLAKDQELIKFQESLETIGIRAFSGCERIKSIEIPKGVTNIKRETFSNCTSLSSFSLHPDVYIIEERAFYNCSDLVDISLPTNLNTLGSYAFSDCRSLQKMTIPQEIKVIEDGIFYKCINLRSVIFIGNISTIKTNAFYQCESLSSINLPFNLTEIESSAFENCYNLESIEFSENVVSINARSFAYCTSLQTFNFPDKLEYLGSNAFFSCRSLQTIVIPMNVNFIGNECFSQCSSLNSVTFYGLTNPSHGNSILDNTQVDRVYVPAKYLDFDFCGYSVKYISTNAFTQSDVFTESSIFTQSPIATIAGITLSESMSFIVSFVSRKSVTNSMSYISSKRYSYIQLDNGEYSLIFTDVYVSKYYPYIIYYLSPTFIRTGILLQLKVQKKTFTPEQLIGVVCGTVAGFFLILAFIIFIIQRNNRTHEIYNDDDLFLSESSDVQLQTIDKSNVPVFKHFGI